MPPRKDKLRNYSQKAAHKYRDELALLHRQLASLPIALWHALIAQCGGTPEAAVWLRGILLECCPRAAAENWQELMKEINGMRRSSMWKLVCTRLMAKAHTLGALAPHIASGELKENTYEEWFAARYTEAELLDMLEISNRGDLS